MSATAQKIVNRPTMPVVARQPAQIRCTPGTIQTASSLKVSSPTDPAEHEAEQTAKRIMRIPLPQSESAVTAKCSPHATRFANTITQSEPLRIARKQEGTPAIPSSLLSEISASQSSGKPLPSSIRQFMEPRFNADFSGVRIHTSEQTARLSHQISAQAFTVGNQVYFGRDRFQPESREGRKLIAHELTHTIQQGAALQHTASVTRQSPVQAQRAWFPNPLDLLPNPLSFIADKARLIPGFRMFTIVLGVNPINMSGVDRSPANVLRAVVEFMPGGILISQALDNNGIFDKVSNWVTQQIASLGMVGSSIKQCVSQFIASLSMSDLGNPGALWERAKRIFTEPIGRIINFVRGLVSGILSFIKNTILLPLARLASGTRGWDLLCAVLGRNPITGAAVPRSAEILIGGFMKLIGQDEVWENMQRANAVPRAFAWFNGALSNLTGFVRQIPALFISTLQSLTIADLVLLPRAFAKVITVFGGFALQFATWAGNAVWNLLEIIFDTLKPGIMGYIRRTGAALKSILKNPLPFVRNLVNAAKSGFLNFARNFVRHLKAGLIDWLTGSLTGVYIPRALNLPELGKFALSVLGITWTQIRGKIVRALGERGETIMRTLETGFDIVVALVRGGPAAIWELLKEKLTDLKDAVVSGIVGFVSETIIMKAIPKLIAMFIPGAGFISAIISIYDTLMVFVQKISRIIQVVTGFINSILAIAAGNIAAAANKVESSLAGLLSLAISFLAGFLGLGKITDKIKGVIEKVRASVDKLLDAAINWIVTKAKALFGKLFGNKDNKEVTSQKGFSLPNEGHTVTAKAKDGNLQVTIHSSREGDILSMLSDAKEEVKSDTTRNESQKNQILSDLSGARQMVLSMKQDWSTAANQKQDFGPWSEARMTQIINILSHLGADGIKTFSDFKGKPLDKRYLPAGYDVRQKLYLRGSGWSANQTSVINKGSTAVRDDVNLVIANRTTKPSVADTAWNRLVTNLCVPYGSTKATLTMTHLANTPYDVDHIDTLSIHWQSGGGNNSKDKPRWDLSNTTRLRYITKRDNLARTKGNYEAWVGKGFASTYSQGGIDNAKLIDGQPFLDAPGGKPV